MAIGYFIGLLWLEDTSQAKGLPTGLVWIKSSMARRPLKCLLCLDDLFEVF